jgi:hypothetical protein
MAANGPPTFLVTVALASGLVLSLVAKVSFSMVLFLCFCILCTSSFDEFRRQGWIQEIQKEGAGTVSAKILQLACGKSMKFKWTITKKVMILSTSQNFTKNLSKTTGRGPLDRPLL